MLFVHIFIIWYETFCDMCKLLFVYCLLFLFIVNRTPSTGKLLNCLIEDGGRVNTNDVYAEIEVMKMVMELRVPQSGW